jgi:hypothetical protein
MMKFLTIITLYSIALTISSCSPSVINTRSVFEREQLTNKQPEESARVVKAYLNDGRLMVIDKWSIDNKKELITGAASIYSPKRKLTASNKAVELSFNDCTLLETNDFHGFNVISPLLMTLTVISSGAMLPCIANPKSCFGSCPTFYLHQNDSLIIQAEGFSSSITKSMEAEDIDFLSAYSFDKVGSPVKIELKNEASESSIHKVHISRCAALPITFIISIIQHKSITIVLLLP